MLQPLPAGRSTFRKLITEGLLYVDKTKWIYEMAKHPAGVYFLSRPRRFGKSLMVSTLAEIFQGNRELFEGLWIYESDYEWQSYPVIRIDFSLERVPDAETLEVIISDYLCEIADSFGLTLPDGRYLKQFRHLIRQLANQGQVVILIDEYDKPITQHITNVKEAIKIRDVLSGFYNVIKASDEYIRFVFLTGISKFSRVGVFSGLNNLTDLTMSPTYSDALGITQEELTTNFAPYIARLAEVEQMDEQDLLAQIRHWYNGFCFSRRCRQVYNPYSLLRLFQENLFANYWFETGTPTLLLNLIKEQQYPLEDISHLKIGSSVFSTYEIDDLALTALLFQTGYLTIKSYDRESRLYELYYPNHEVEDSFLTYILRALSKVQHSTTENHLWRLSQALKQKKFTDFFESLQIFLAGIPYDMQIKREAYYQTVFYLIVRLVGVKASAEERTNKGRIDTVIELEESFIIFEFKLDGTAQEALEQIKKTDYAQKYQLEGKEIICVGVNFSTETRQVSEWKVTDAAGGTIEASATLVQESEQQESEQQAREQALLEQAQGFARNMLASGFDVAQVALLTGLPVEDVQALVEAENGN